MVMKTGPGTGLVDGLKCSENRMRTGQNPVKLVKNRLNWPKPAVRQVGPVHHSVMITTRQKAQHAENE